MTVENTIQVSYFSQNVLYLSLQFMILSLVEKNKLLYVKSVPYLPRRLQVKEKT